MLPADQVRSVIPHPPSEAAALCRSAFCTALKTRIPAVPIALAQEVLQGKMEMAYFGLQQRGEFLKMALLK